MPSDPTHPEPDKFLTLAVELTMLDARQAARAADEARERNVTSASVAIESGWLDSVQVDALQALAQPRDVAPGFELLSMLGHGGLGVVYRAHQGKLDRVVALKTILLGRLADASIVARFQQEARVVGRLQHPNIVTAYDFGTHAGRLYLVMELVDGGNLHTRIRHQGACDEATAWQVARQVAAGLAHAAALGIVHRDIKPANLLCAVPPAGSALPPGVPLIKIADFGLARLTDESHERTNLTRAGTGMGTPQYMAPEQIADARVDHRADIYALGATVFEMLAARAPFEGCTSGQVLAGKLRGDRRWLSDLPAEVSAPTRELLHAMLDDDPTQRPADYGELLARIDAVLATCTPGAPSSSMAFSVGRAAAATLLSPGAAAPGQATAPALAAGPVTVGPAQGETLADAAPLAAAGSAAALPGAPRGWWVHRRRLLMAAVGLAGLVLGVAIARQPRGQVAHVPSDWSEYLFDGRTLDGWTRIRGAFQSATDAEGGTVLAGLGSIVRPLPRPSDPVRLLRNYAVSFEVELREADAVELHFDGDVRDDAAGRFVLRLTPGEAVVGERDAFGAPLTSVDAPVPLRERPRARHAVRLERHASYWKVLVDGTIVGTASTRREALQPQIQLVAEGGRAYFADLLVTELVPPGDFRATR